MHCDIHRQLHAYRATELHTVTAAAHKDAKAHRPRTGVRTLVGWKMVEVGLRLAQSRPHPAAARAPRTV